MPLDNFNILKAMTREELMAIVPDDFSFHTDPWLHQIASFIACIANDHFLLALDLGTGKTKVSIDVCRYIQQQTGYVNAVVVCLDAAVEKWVDEIHTHSDTLKGVPVRGQIIRDGGWWDKKSRIVKTAKEVKLDVLCDTSANFRVVSFEGLRSICTERIKQPGSNKGHDQVHYPTIKRIIDTRPNVFIIDESHKIKNNKALIFLICDMLSANIQHRYFLTGTPFHKLLDIWAQYYVLDRGDTFGTSFFQFRRDNFEERKKFIKRAGIEISNWVPTPQGKRRIQSLMYSKAIRYDESEVHDMPGKVWETIKFRLSKEQRDDYIDIMAGVKGSGKNYGGNSSMTYRQICSGFIIKTRKIYKTNPKIDHLKTIVESVYERDKLVIFYEFDLEHDAIAKMLKKMKVKFTSISGKVKSKYKNNQLFLNDEKVRVCITSIKAGSASIDLQSARYAVFYSIPQSVIDWKQAIKRIHRGEIKRTRFYYNLVAMNTIEVSMQKSLKEGVDLFDEVMDGDRFRKVLKGEI